MWSEHGRTSPSFIIAILLLVVGVGGYGAWRVVRPDPNQQSEQLVRDSRQALNAEVSDFRRELGILMDKKNMDAEAKIAAVDEVAKKAMRGIDEYLDNARRDLAELDIALGTHKNRSDRLAEKADYAKKMVEEGVDHAKARIRGG